MRRFANAFTAFLFGCGILVLCVGLFSDAYSWKLGVIGHGHTLGGRLCAAGLPDQQERRLRARTPA